LPAMAVAGGGSVMGCGADGKWLAAMRPAGYDPPARCRAKGEVIMRRDYDAQASF
jgi:hypothetical protein